MAEKYKKLKVAFMAMAIEGIDGVYEQRKVDEAIAELVAENAELRKQVPVWHKVEYNEFGFTDKSAPKIIGEYYASNSTHTFVQKVYYDGKCFTNSEGFIIHVDEWCELPTAPTEDKSNECR